MLPDHSVYDQWYLEQYDKPGRKYAVVSDGNIRYPCSLKMRELRSQHGQCCFVSAENNPVTIFQQMTNDINIPGCMSKTPV